MLAVFSLPTEGTVLALRRERYSLTQLVRQIAGKYGRAIELHVLQYGVTPQRLRDALRDGRGWDVVHFSGHGLADGLVLERPDGTGDLVRTPDLVGLLRPARQRLKLVCLSSCLSAAGTAAEARRMLSLDVPKDLDDEAKASAGVLPLPGLARELVRRLDCAVLAMRFSVVDDFAIALNQQLYEGLLGQDQELARAVQLALPEAAGDEPSMEAPAISVATPALFGPLATSLLLSPPLGQPSFNVGTSKVAYFPEEPERFVGRVGALARASTALAPQNQQRHTTVLFHGMAGAGKTACALELAYRHEQAFVALVWWKAPEQGRDITTSLRDLAVAMETQLPGFNMVHAVGSETELRRFLPRLTQLLEDQAILLVLDNLESLLTDEGRWRDPNWGLLVDALVEHRGNSRAVLTSRVPPAGLDGWVLVEPVNALSLDEALLLARELPNLGQLLRRNEGTGAQRGQEAVSGWELVRRVLEVVQGHPTLLGLADADAADPKALQARLLAVEQELPGQDRLQTFFAQGQSALSSEQFLGVLQEWTWRAVDSLAEGPRVLWWVLCALEEADRWQPVVELVWPDIWQRLGHAGKPPVLGEAMAVLVAHALVQVEQAGNEAPGRYQIHPGIAQAGRRRISKSVQTTVNQVLAGFWQEVFRRAREGEGGEAGELMVQAGRNAVPYLLRLKDWATASWLLERVISRSNSLTTVQAVLPWLRHIAAATKGTERELLDACILAKALRFVEPQKAEGQLRELIERSVAEGRFNLASAVSADLATLLSDAGRFEEALSVLEAKKDYVRRAGLGPWTQLSNEQRRLNVLRRLGRNEEVLQAVQALRPKMAALGSAPEHHEQMLPSHVREDTLRVGAIAASELERFEEALELNAEVTQSVLSRGGSQLDWARPRLNSYFPLIRLGRLAEGRQLLDECRDVFEEEGDMTDRYILYGYLADLEDELGHYEDAVRFGRAALRYSYASGNPDAVSAGHFNLADYGGKAGDDQAIVFAHRLVSAVVSYQIGSARLAAQLGAVADTLGRLDTASLPGSFEALCETIEQAEGVRVAELAARLPGPAADGDQALAAVLRLARDLPATPADPAQAVVDQWAPVIDAVAAAAGGDAQAAKGLAPLLAKLDTTADWAALAGVLRRIMAGERGGQLLAGLDPTDTLIVTAVLNRLHGQPNIPTEE
jgi:tetratricopeptide (TPR) repeat protein